MAPDTVPAADFVKPVRIPEEVEWQIADPPVARAREAGRWRLRFVVSEAVPAGAEVGILLDGGRNVKGSFRPIQVDDPSAAGYVSVARGDGGRIEPLELSGPGQVTFQAPTDGLQKGEAIEVDLGGETGTVPPQFSLPNKMVLLFLSLPPEDSAVPKSNQEPPKRIIGACVLHITGTRLDHLRVYAPSQAQVGEPFAVLVRPEDEFANVASERPGELVVRLGDKTLDAGRTDLEHSACARLEGIVLDEPGIVRLEVEAPADGLLSRANPIRCVRDLGELDRLHYWGMIHGHTELSDGAGSIDHYFTYMQDECLLDFGAAGDHDHVFETSDEMWAMTQEATARYNEPKRFVTFLGYEWAKWRRNGDGDRNVYYLRDHRPMFRSDEGHSPSPPDLFRALEDETAIVIPHHSANIGNHCDWKDHDRGKERLVEIFSQWGCSERSVNEGNVYVMRPSNDKPDQIDSGEVPAGFVQRALALGWRVGFTAGGDDHMAHPGDEIKSGGHPPRCPGLLAVRAAAQTREAIWEALYERNCYGTTGARMIVDFSLNGAAMGSELRLTDHPELLDRRRLSVTVHGTARVEKVEVVRNNEDVFTYEGDAEDESFEWEDMEPFDDIALPPAPQWDTPFCFYYLRVTQTDGEMAWVSPVWVSP
jgi:hypothetical protein